MSAVIDNDDPAETQHLPPVIATCILLVLMVTEDLQVAPTPLRSGTIGRLEKPHLLKVVFL